MDLFDPQRFAVERNALDDLLDAVLKVSSVQGGRAAPQRHPVGVQLYTRLTVAGVTLLRLLPGNRLIEERWTPWWDLPSLAAVARSIIEAYLGFHYYIAVESVLPEEDQFRRKYSGFMTTRRSTASTETGALLKRHFVSSRTGYQMRRRRSWRIRYTAD